MMGLSMWLYSFLFFIFQLQFASSTQPFPYSPPPPPPPSYNHFRCPYEQSLALLHFKQNFSINSYSFASSDCDYSGQPSQPKTMSWNMTTDCCKWDGVTCDGFTGQVIGLDLSCSQLTGIIPSNSTLFQLSHLKRLNLAFNDFSSSRISHHFGRFVSLTHLNLSFSNFSGHIPSEISHLSKLVSLDLSLYPSFPIVKLEPHNLKMLLQNLTQLRELSLSDVDISSVFPMNLSSSLTLLDLSYTGLHGKLPDEVFHLPYLQTLGLSSNSNLTGHLAKVNVSSSSQLKQLDLSYCNFFGTIPEWVGNLTQITHLSLSGNNFGAGPIPSVFANLRHLSHLYLRNSNVTGLLPSSIANLPQLVELYLSSNSLTGAIPSSIANLTQLLVLDLSSNSLTGPLPSNIYVLQNLTYLRLSNNKLNGTIPSFLFAHPSLWMLDLSSNLFSGPIEEFRNYTVLSTIDLSYNQLHGSIPHSISKLVNLYYLLLPGNNLMGIVELDMFTNLTLLQLLDLSYNSLSVSNTNINSNATLPSLTRLYLSSCNVKEFPYLLRSSAENFYALDLSHNFISHLPNWAESLWRDSLNYLNLSHNFLTGLEHIPWNNILFLDIRNNSLQGPLPSTVCHLTSLLILDLSHNSFGGEILQCLGNLSRLSVLDLRMNSFHGAIPTTFAKGNRFRSINFNGNQLVGKLPRSLANCRQLEVLDLGNNHLNDTFPPWLGTLLQLQVLILKSNRFHGFLPETSKTKSPFSKLRIMDLSHNEFSGHLPSEYFRNFKAIMNVDENIEVRKYMGQGSAIDRNYYDDITVVLKGQAHEMSRIFTIFKTIDLSSNKFEGDIPNVIGDLKSLNGLNLSHNHLRGHIPPVLGNISALESLDLSSNQLEGKIPENLTSLTFLAVLNLSHNHLVGPIPRGKQFDTFTNASYSGNLALCGLPLSKNCGNDETPQPPPPPVQQRDDSDFESGFTWQVVCIGYACGTVFGLVMGYLMFSAGKPKWITRLVEEQTKKVKRPAKRAHRRRN